jgi:hypothetical protein
VTELPLVRTFAREGTFEPTTTRTRSHRIPIHTFEWLEGYDRECPLVQEEL